MIFHAVHVGELVVRGDCVLGAALRVLHYELDHAPVDAAGSVDLVDRKLLRLAGNRSVSLAGACERFHHSYLERFVARIVPAGGSQERQDCQ